MAKKKRTPEELAKLKARRAAEQIPDDAIEHHEAVADDGIDLDGLNKQITRWVDERRKQPLSPNDLADFIETLHQASAHETNRDHLIKEIQSAWPDQKARTLGKMWKDIETQVWPRGAPSDDGAEVTAQILSEMGIEDPDPYPHPVNGRELAQAIETELRQFVTTTDEHRTMMTLWVIHTHCLDHEWLSVSPRLMLTSPTRGCGKSTTADVLLEMCHRPIQSSSISGPSFFRCVEALQPTVNLDELDSGAHKKDMFALLKDGHRKSRSRVIRTLPGPDGDFVVKGFRVFSAAILSGIGKTVDEALDSRCLSVTLHGRTKAEACEALRLRERERARMRAEIVPRIMRWAADNEESLNVAADMDDSVVLNRDFDNWEVLFKIAAVIGGEWPARFDAAVQAAITARPDAHFRGGDILTDIVRLAVDEANHRSANGTFTDWTDLRFTGMELHRGLVTIDDGKWLDPLENRRPLTPRGVTMGLAAFGIKSENKDDPSQLTHIPLERPKDAQAAARARRAAMAGNNRKRCRSYLMANLQDAIDRYVDPADLSAN